MIGGGQPSVCRNAAAGVSAASLCLAVAIAAAVGALAATAVLRGAFTPGGRFAGLQRAEALEKTFAEARDAQLEGRVDDARRLFSDLVLAQPFNAMARLQLAILLQDSAGDPAGAMGHFEAYLRLAPGSDKEELARNRLQLARDQIARRFGAIERHGASDADVERVSAELAEVRAALEKAEAAREEAEAQRDKAAEDASKLQRTVSGLQRQIDILQGGGVSHSRNRPTAAELSDSGPRTYRVKRGDTLLGIAQRVYGDATRNRDIREANPGIVGEDDSIREGDLLTLP